MLGSRLTRRIVLPILLLLGVLFGVLAVAGVWIAQHRVDKELDRTADRVAGVLAEIPLVPEHRKEILPSLAHLVGAEIAVVGSGPSYATQAGWTDAEIGRLHPGRITLAGVPYVVRERTEARGGRRIYLLTAEEVVSQRVRDVLVPVVATGAFGLLVAALLGILVARTIARPVRRLAATAREVASGDFRGTLERQGPGEIGDLEEAFGRMLASLRESERKLRENERFAALGRLAGGIAHELRNPLTAIRMAVETVTADAPGREDARKIALSELDRLDRTLRELLDYVRPRAPRRTRIDARELFSECAELLRPQCEHMRVHLETEAPEGLYFEADADRIKQAILNLVLNAAQAQPGGGSVWLEASPGVISVRDAGPGIPGEVRESLFEPFVTTKAAGIGLGLAVVKQVVEEHGGRVEVDTGPQGTTFRLRLE